MTFGKLLKKHKEASGLSSTDMSRRLGVTLTYVRNLEEGKKKPPTFERCKDLVNILGIQKSDVEQFLRAAFIERLKGDDRKFYDKLFGGGV
jgi:transcriptional regulator with XRE-family HTH domain